MGNKEFISQAISNGYEMNISQYFSKGWELFKKNAGGFIAFLFVYIIISSILSLIPIIGPIINAIISPAISLGWAIMSYQLSHNEDTDFNYFFKGFDKFSELIVAAIIQFVIFFIIVLPLIIIMIFTFGFSALVNSSLNMDGHIGTGLIITVVVFVLFLGYISMCMRWTYQLIYFHDYKAMEAITASFKLVNKQPLQHLILLILYVLTFIGGILAIVIGLIIAIPLIYCTDYCAFEDVTGLLHDEEDNYDITENLI